MVNRGYKKHLRIEQERRQRREEFEKTGITGDEPVDYSRAELDAAGMPALPGVYDETYEPFDEKTIAINSEFDLSSQHNFFPLSKEDEEFARNEFDSSNQFELGEVYRIKEDDVPADVNADYVNANLALKRWEEIRKSNKEGGIVVQKLQAAAARLESAKVKNLKLFEENLRLVEILQGKSAELTRLKSFYDKEAKMSTRGFMGQRIPPFSEESERAVLGLMILHPQLRRSRSQPYLNLMFYVPAHRAISAAMMDLGEKLDPVSLVDNLHQKGSLDMIGGEATISRILEDAKELTPNSFENHFKSVEDRYILRDFIMQLRDTEGKIYNDQAEIKSVPEFVRLETTEMLKKVLPRRFRMHEDLRAEVDETIESFEELVRRKGRPSVSTGYGVLDSLTHGCLPGKLHVCGADTKMGKTTLMANLADNVASQGHHVLVFTYESSRRELVQKLISKYARVDSEFFEYFDSISQSDAEAIAKAARESVRELPIMIEDGRSADLEYIVGRTNAVKLQYPDLALVIVDGMQSFKGYKPYEGTKASIYTEVLKGLKEEVSVKQKVTTLLTAQLKTAQVYRRANRRPYRLDDFADCNDIPKVADSAFCLYRPEGYIGQDEKSYFTQEKLQERGLLGKVEIIPVALRVGDRTKKGGWLGVDIVTSNIFELEPASVK